jgi:hypothetical protein
MSETSKEIAKDFVRPFTKDDLDNCWPYYKDYFVDVLNGEYDLSEAREDLRSLVNSRFDKRIEKHLDDKELKF